MKNIRQIFLALILSSIAFSGIGLTSTAQADELSPEMFLNKITHRLIGRWPRPSEFRTLSEKMKEKNCKAVSCMEDHFRSYIREKMKEPEFYALFYGQVTERFGYKSPPSPNLSEIARFGEPLQQASYGRDFALVYRTLKDDQSFDELYTSQIVTDPVWKDISAGRRMIIDLAKMPMSAGSPTAEYPITLENGDTIGAAEFNLKGHANISGLFSSLTFLGRYWDGPRNENRKRAAAYFRIMLCDSMSPALERESEKEKERRMALGMTDEAVIIDEHKKRGQNLHGTQKDCAMCHSRLEPVANTMFAMEQGISNESFADRAKFKNAAGEDIEIQVENFHDLIVKTTKQPQYLDCQTKWLMTAFLGNDLKISTKRLSEVAAGIESKKRRLRSVIEDILMIPEFRGLGNASAEPPTMVAAKNVLSNCSECHGSLFSMRAEQMKARLARINVCLDLPNNGSAAEMPPSEHYWRPSAEEIGHVKAWLKEGAPVEVGSPLFQKNEVDALMTPNKEVRKCRQ